MSVRMPTPEGHPTPAGSTVSRYVVLGELGRGGMGRVLRAYDPKLQREVALKEVHHGQLGSDGTQRLIAEARAMAKLSHPHVVAVYDVEVVDAQVMLVMEYVRGTTLQTWLRSQRHTWREVVDRFIDAGRGLAAAHEAGLLHRDFKPANVLVADIGTVKVTDFGLAEATTEASQSPTADDGSLDDDLTAAGSVLGTPRYMAPEQHRGERLSAAADQYALCLALWEGLCSAPPFSGPAMAKDKAAGPPPWTNRETPRPIAEAIVRGLSPRPEDRWPSVEALLQALAWDPRRRRNRGLLALGGLSLLVGGGGSYSAWAQVQAERCSGAGKQLVGIWDEERRAAVQSAFGRLGKRYADDAWRRTEDALEQYATEWRAMYTDACEASTVRGEQSSEMMDLRMSCLHRAVVDLQAAVEVLAKADTEVVQKAQEVTGGLRPVERCADTEALMADVEPPEAEEAEAVEAARAHLAQGWALQKAGKYSEAKGAVDAAKTVLTGVGYGPVQAEVARCEAVVLDSLGAFEASQAALEEAVRLGSRWGQWDELRSAAAELMYVVGYRQQRMDEALRIRPFAEGLAQGDPEAEADFRNSLGLVLREQGKYAEAEAELRAALALREAALGPEHPNVAYLRNGLAIVLKPQGKYAEAEAELRAALALFEAALGPEHPDVAMSRNNLANALVEQGKYAEAEAELRAALPLFEAALGPKHPHVATSRHNLAIALEKQGKYAEAETEHRAALALREAVLGAEHPDIASSRHQLAIVLYDQGRYAEAEVELRAALALRESAFGPEHPYVAMSRNNLANALAEQGKYAEVETEYRAALTLLEAALGPEHPDVAGTRTNLAVTLLELHRPAEAQGIAELAWTRLQKDDIPAERRAETAFVLARILWTVAPPDRDRTRARTLAEDAASSFGRAGKAFEEELRAVQQWLARANQP